jgi:hypothetical protein
MEGCPDCGYDTLELDDDGVSICCARPECGWRP